MHIDKVQLIGLAIKRSRAADFFKEKLSGLADFKNGIDGRSAENFGSDSFWVGFFLGRILFGSVCKLELKTAFPVFSFDASSFSNLQT